MRLRAQFLQKKFLAPSGAKKSAEAKNFLSASETPRNRARYRAAGDDFSALGGAPGFVTSNDLARSNAFGSILSHSCSSSLALGSGQTRR
jgi:hypothetical protein